MSTDHAAAGAPAGLSDAQKALLLHALGLGPDNLDAVAPTRNRWADDPNPTTAALVSAGLLRDHGPHTWMGGMHAYTVTEEGQKAALRIHLALREARPKGTAGQRRYREWLRADSGLPFWEWLRVRRGSRV